MNILKKTLKEHGFEEATIWSFLRPDNKTDITLDNKSKCLTDGEITEQYFHNFYPGTYSVSNATYIVHYTCLDNDTVVIDSVQYDWRVFGIKKVIAEEIERLIQETQLITSNELIDIYGLDDWID